MNFNSFSLIFGNPLLCNFCLPRHKWQRQQTVHDNPLVVAGNVSFALNKPKLAADVSAGGSLQRFLTILLGLAFLKDKQH